MPFALAIGPVFEFLNTIISRAFPDKTEAAKVQAAFQLAVLQGDVQNMLAQIDTNKQEAASNSLFVAGWRPFVGWCCGGAFAYSYIVQPFMEFIFAAAGHPVGLPKIDLSGMTPVLLGMLGLAGMRSYEKVAGNGNGNGKANGH